MTLDYLICWEGLSRLQRSINIGEIKRMTTFSFNMYGNLRELLNGLELKICRNSIVQPFLYF